MTIYKFYDGLLSENSCILGKLVVVFRCANSSDIAMVGAAIEICRCLTLHQRRRTMAIVV